MCLAIPGRVETIDETTDLAEVSVGKVRKQVSVALIEDLQVGDYVLVHVGYALNKISPEEAEKTLALFEEAGLTVEQAMESPA